MNKKLTKRRKKKIDSIDCKLIRLLQKDGRVPNTEIEKKLGISEATVRARLTRLIDEEYIRIVAIGNPLNLGLLGSSILKWM